MSKRPLFLLLALLLVAPVFAQSKNEQIRQKDWTPQQVQGWLDSYRARPLSAPQADCPDFTSRRDVIMNGNKITTQIFNFGSISAPGNTITDIVWNGLGYGYEFGPFVAAEVVDTWREDGREKDPQSVPLFDDNGQPVLNDNGEQVFVMYIVSDGIVSNGGEISPDGSEFWSWQPIPCAQPVGSFEGLQVVNPNSDKIPTNDAPDADLDGKPDSWPEDFYNETLGRYLWPGALQQGASNADKEALYFMNDYGNKEFNYYPFVADSTRRGLGLETEVRMYQWANPLAEDTVFLVYKITNKSDKDLEDVIFGMWGDPHIGGPGNWQDDFAYFDKSLNMVFAWDADGRSDVAGRTPGYFGYKFLESPGVEDDGIDNDGDGLVDESWVDGIDNDGDWDIDRDDVGLDGVQGTGDEGEGDGVPTAGDQFDITKPGEPNFEFTDIDESDQIGLTSFDSPPFAGNRISNDERVWDQVQPGLFSEVPPEPGDYVFLYGAGKFRLKAGETKRFSIALIVGENREDLTLNAETAQQIYNVGYRFAKPPDKPTVRAVPGDKKVTLYWDDVAEASFDPLTNDNDFEGYVIYRSTDHEFSDQQTITDINGSKFLYSPLKNALGVEARFDLKNGLSGPSPIPFANRGVSYDLGDDTGLFHTYVDNNNVVNGQTYYYTVVAYDRGFAGDGGEAFRNGIPPTETTKTVTYDPTTDSYIFDKNTVAVTPRPKVAGYIPPAVIDADGIVQTGGAGTGDIRIDIVDELAVLDNQSYTIDFNTVDNQVVYSVIFDAPVTTTFSAAPGKFAATGYRNIVPGTVSVQTADGRTLQEGTDYIVDPAFGSIQILGGAGVSDGSDVTATFKYAPIAQSANLANEEANLVFNGIHLFIDDDELALDEAETGWVQGGNNIPFEAQVAASGPGRVAQAADYEIRFADSPIGTSFNNNIPIPFEIINLTKANQPIDAFAPDINRNGVWDVVEPIIFIETLDGAVTATWQVTFEDAGSTPGSGDVFYLRTTKPFSDADKFSFHTQAAQVDQALATQELGDIYVVPNPYVATNAIEPRNPISRTARGERRLYFANVPQQCTIRIYTLAGELVDTIEHNSTIDDGKVFWDLRTKDEMNLAYGLYLFHVDSPEGSFIGKFAVIK